MSGMMVGGLDSGTRSTPNRLLGLQRRQAVRTEPQPSKRTARWLKPSALLAKKEEKRTSPQRGPDPVHFRTESAPELPAHVRPSASEVRRLQSFRREHQHFKDGDYRKGLLYGGRSADWVWVMSLPGGTLQKELRVDLAPGMTAHDLAEAARRAWGWDSADELRVFFLGSELHPLWLLDDCGVQDLCQLRIARRRAAALAAVASAVTSHPIAL